MTGYYAPRNLETRIQTRIAFKTGLNFPLHKDMDTAVHSVFCTRVVGKKIQTA